LVLDQSPIRMVTSQVSVNTRRAGVHVLTARERTHEVSVYLVGSGIEILVLLLSKRHDGSTGRNTRVVGVDKVMGVGGGRVAREGSW
jgi:hypothetical protein